MILSKNDMFKVSTLYIAEGLEKCTILVFSDNFNQNWAKPVSIYTVLKGRPFFVGIITEERKGDCFNDRFWDYKIFVDPFKFREEGVILDAYFDLTISNPPGKASIIYYCLYECRLKNIKKIWQEEALADINKIRRKLFDHIKYNLTKLFNPADPYLPEKIIYAHNKGLDEIDFSLIATKEGDLQDNPIYFYDPYHEGDFKWGLVNGNFLDHRVLHFSKPKVARKIKNMTQEEFLKLISSIHWDMPHSEKTWRKCYNPANYYLKFENEEEFVNRLEKVLLEEEKKNEH